MAHDYGVRLALIAFATAAVQGAFTGAAFEPGLKFALAAAALFYGLGLVCGELARRIVIESVAAEFQPPASPETVSPTPIPTPTRR